MSICVCFSLDISLAVHASFCLCLYVSVSNLKAVDDDVLSRAVVEVSPADILETQLASSLFNKMTDALNNSIAKEHRLLIHNLQLWSRVEKSETEASQLRQKVADLQIKLHQQTSGKIT